MMELARGPPASPRRPRVPTGYHFTPTPEELIRGYLNPWITGQLPAESQGIVGVADVYSADPDTLTSRFQHLGHDGNWYFLCVNQWKSGSVGTRMNRSVDGGGTWNNSSRRKPVGRDGCRQGFEYRHAADVKTPWLMDEFATSLTEATDGEGVRVICKVHRTPRAPAAAKEEEHEEITDKVGSKRGRRLHQEHSIATVSAPPAPDYVGWSYAGTSQSAAVSAAAPTITWQQPMTEQAGMEYQCAGVHGGVYTKEELEPLEAVDADVEWQQFAQRGYGFLGIPLKMC